MNPIHANLMALVASYFLGAIPFGLLAGKLKGIDIRQQGSGNIGATNVFRCVGKSWGVAVYFLDMLKGFVAAYVFPRLAAAIVAPEPLWEYLGIACACLAVAGHNWPVYLRFRGGKGIATTTGGLLGVAPAAMGIGVAVWPILFLTTRYVSLASIGAALAVGVAAWMLYGSDQPPVLASALTLLAVVAIWRHRANIRRLAAGTENRFSFKRKTGTAKP